MPDVRVPESTADRHVGLTYVDAPVNYLADLSVKPVTYNPPLGTGLPRREGNYRFFTVRVHNARPYVNELNLEDVNFLIESLRYTKRNFESTNYPTEALRRQQLEQVDQVMEKLRRIRDSLK